MITIKVQNKNNSSLKTKELIKKTFAELMNEKKSLSNITVTELVKRANINRGTFYTHYDNLYDVAEDFETEAIDFFINDEQELNTWEQINEYFDKLILHLKQNEITYKMLLSSSVPPVSLNKLNKLLKEKIKEFLTYNHLYNYELNVIFFVDGFMTLVLRYLKEEIPYTLDEINEKAKELFRLSFINK